MAPMLFIAEFFQEPVPDAILFFGRQRGEFRDRRIQRSGHDVSIPNVASAAQQRLHPTAAAPAVSALAKIVRGRRG